MKYRGMREIQRDEGIQRDEWNTEG